MPRLRRWRVVRSGPVRFVLQASQGWSGPEKRHAKELNVFKKIDHVEIVTNEPEKTAEFYTGVLGFREKFRDRVTLPDGGGSLDIQYLDLGGTAVELLTYQGVPAEPAAQKLQLGYR